MSFEIRGKVALVTGGASGMGLCYVKELLRYGVKGVTIADINADLGQKVLKEIVNEFGPNKAIFVVTDVSNKQNFEKDKNVFSDAFIKTIEQFKNVDILINNAAILNDLDYEKAIAINVKGTLHGMLLGLENYLQKYKSGSEGVIVNISSIASVSPEPCAPIYTATKFAVFGMSKAWGCEEHYQRTKIRILCVCPGATDTPIFDGARNRLLGAAYKKIFDHLLETLVDLSQKPEHVGRTMMKLIENARNGSAWIIEEGQEPYEYVLPLKESFISKK